MSTVGERLKEALNDSGATVSEFAGAVGVSSQAVSQWLSGETKSPSAKNLLRAAAFLRVSGVWLTEGKGPKHTELPSLQLGSALNATVLDNNVSPPEPPRRRVPLISWVQAGQFCPIIDNFEAGTAEQWVASPRHVGPQAFALEVHGDSMADEFKEGDIIIVDPDQEARPGDMVVVRNGDAEATFKKLTKDGNDWWLTPLNRQYAAKPMPKDAVICGRVMAKIPKPAFY